MRRPLLLLGAASLVLVFLIFLFSGGEPGQVQVDGDAAGAPEAGAVSAPDIEAPPAESAREAAAVAEVAAALAPAPESYRKALSGLIGRLVEPDRTPVPDMRVELLSATLTDFIPELESLFADEAPTFNEVKGETRTDAEGRFHFEEIEPRSVLFLGIDLGGARALVRFVDNAPNPGQLVDLGDVVLEPYVVFLGRVVDEERRPVPGARVRATNLPSIIFSFGVQDLRHDFTVAFQEDLGEDWRVAPIPRWITRLVERFPVPQTRTAEDGTFRLEGVPLGLVTVLADKEGLVSLVHGPVPSGEGGERQLGDLELRFGEVLSGRVVDLVDEPVAGAAIIAGAQLELAPAAVMAPVAVTDAEGRFQAKGFKDVEHVVAARPEDGVEWTIVTGAVPGYDEVLIRIGATFPLTVIARDESGEIVPRPSLVVRPIGRLPLHPLLVAPIPLARRLSFREDGAAVVRDLDPGSYSVLAKAEGFAVGAASADLGLGPATVDIPLVRELAGRVLVVEAGTREPVHHALVGVFEQEAQRELRMVPLLTRRSGADGFVLLPGLKRGTYKVAAFHPAYASGESVMDVPGAAPGQAAVIELRQGGTLQGRVKAGAQPPEAARFIAVGRKAGEDFPRFTVTGEEGAFEITHLAEGEYTVTVMRRFADRSLGDMFSGGFEQYVPERFVDATISEGQVTFLEIDILGTAGEGPTAKLRGSVIVNSAPAAGMVVQAQPRGSWVEQKSVQTDGNGAFDFGEVPAGKLNVSVRQRGRAGRFMVGRLAEQAVDLVENEVRELRFDIRTGGVEGRVVLDRDGSPVVAAEVSLRAEDAGGDFSGTRLQTVSDAAGRFSFELVPAGTYRLRADRKDLADAHVGGIEVPFGGQPPPVEVRMTAGVFVRGTVELPSGAEQPRFMYVNFRGVENRDARGGDRVNLETMEFAIEGLASGRYEVTAYGGQVEYDAGVVDVPRDGVERLALKLVAKASPTPLPFRR
ncbi:MAG: carboxypeptidase regulatory-like domain-containing protein [Planctomycetes bacterium]|nr:carboxypeptidase regulatory-like domain-containing protein [Planctomycetota bacterium]